VSAPRQYRVFVCGVLVVLLALVGVLAVACDETEGDFTTKVTIAGAVVSTPTSASSTTVTETTSTTFISTGGTVVEEFVFGMVLAGSHDDGGWSQANYEGGLYVERNLPGARMIYVDDANPSDQPDITPEQLARTLVGQGAQMIFFTSSDMEEDAVAFAKSHPDIPVVCSSGDTAWKDGQDYRDVANLSNIMGRMEYGTLIAGAAAALTTKTGKIGYLGPLIDLETRRLAASVYLGAKYAWTEYLGKDPAKLEFSVNWIGYWFNIPGTTSDPTKVTEEFFDKGYDVVVSGIDTNEALTEAGNLSRTGKEVWAIPYGYAGSLEEFPAAALGVPYFNWGPAYLEAVETAREDQWSTFWLWRGPDWSDMSNLDTSMIGFAKGEGLSADASAKVDDFVDALAGGMNLWTGPLNLQDGTPYLAEGEVATDQQIWYLPQLLEGMQGLSAAE
jgi:simple sugar transport system substrate-binding protein